MEIKYEIYENGESITKCPNGEMCYVGDDICEHCNNFCLNCYIEQKVVCEFERQ